MSVVNCCSSKGDKVITSLTVGKRLLAIIATEKREIEVFSLIGLSYVP